ncbi:hypothetical protein JW921_00880 [Candidatus Fermentibacterales bacterium]|nr:hypothetical protein [Candidatus Fermentibacterales bacterium]
MMRAVVAILVLFALASADLVPGRVRDTWVEAPEVTQARERQTSMFPGVPDRDAQVLFIFSGMDFTSEFAWGDVYWNPTEELYPSTWSYDTIEPSSTEPPGSPYHWNGGLGTACDNLGVTWEWYATYDAAEYYQNIPDAATLANYDVVFFHTFDYWWSDVEAVSADSRAILETYMNAGGTVVLIGQDIHYSGVPGSWLNTWFGCGTIVDDVVNGEATAPASGESGTFLAGWSGTAQQTNFSNSNPFFVDDVATNGLLGDGGSNQYASYLDAEGRIYSTFEFEACSSSETEAIMEEILDWLGILSLDTDTWGGIKVSF